MHVKDVQVGDILKFNWNGYDLNKFNILNTIYKLLKMDKSIESMKLDLGLMDI